MTGAFTNKKGASVAGRPRNLRLKALDGLQIDGRAFAALRVVLNFVSDLLAFVQGAEASALNGRDVQEHVRAASFRLNEAVTLGAVKPFHSASGHVGIPSSQM